MLPIVTVVVGMLVSVGTLFFVRRAVGYRRLAESNEVASAFFTTIGTIYAVILAFMVFAVWTDFQEGQSLCDREANELVTLVRLSAGLSPEVGDDLRRKILDYAHSVIDDEWPKMLNGGESDRASAELRGLWPILMRVNPRSLQEQTLFDHSLAHLETLRQLRRSRLFMSHEDLPAVLWSVLAFGAWVTLVSACLFGLPNGGIHAFQTAMLAALLVFVLYAVAEMKHPFQGRVHVEPTSLRVAIQEMQ